MNITFVHDLVKDITIPKNTRLFLTGSFVNPHKQFRPDSDIDIWLVSSVPDKVEGNTIYQESVPMSQKQLEKQLPVSIEGHAIHVLIPTDHPVLFRLPSYSVLLKEE